MSNPSTPTASQLEAAHASNPISLAEALREALADYLTLHAEHQRLREENARLRVDLRAPQSEYD